MKRNQTGAGRAIRPLLAGVAILMAAVAGAPAQAAPVSALLVDANDGHVLYADQADRMRPPASLAKLMTLFLTFDALQSGRLHLTDRVVMTRHAAAQAPTKLGLQPGQSLTVDQAIRALVVQSANDVAVALGEKLAGNEPAFARRMTERARSLGLQHTTFVNASGLPDRRNVTTARDIATLSVAMIRMHPQQYGYFSTREFDWGKRHIPSHNHLLGVVAGVDGLKTGYTADAGYNLAASAKRGGTRLVAVVLGEHSIVARDRRVARLLDVGFASLPKARTQASVTRSRTRASAAIDAIMRDLALKTKAPGPRGPDAPRRS